MATIQEIARYSGLLTATVLRVVLREPTNEDAKRRVAEAVQALGPPEYPRPDGSIEVLPADAVPAVPEAVRSELAQIGDLRRACESLVSQLERERRERIEDLELVTDLLITGWAGVDRRLGRLEKVIGRIDEAQRASSNRRAGPNLVRLESWLSASEDRSEERYDRK
jgi:hypothetical protein